ncbi:MAG: hypothetical protein ACOH2H_18345 [Cypionkella sp.]
MTQPKRILFGQKLEWEAGLRTNADPGAFEIVMADLRFTALSGFDAIVPLELSDQECLTYIGTGLPALLTPGPIRRLCHDKLMLNRHLIDLGFGDHIPTMRDRLPADAARHPVIIKARKAAWGNGTWLLLDTPVPDQIWTSLGKDSHFIQDYLPGRIEYASHVLMHRGVPQFCQTIEYDMGSAPAVKGTSQPPLNARWLTQTPWQDVLLRILAAIGFDEGTCCFDYRMVDGTPMLFEINPRFGGSLAAKITPYLHCYLACPDRP